MSKLYTDYSNQTALTVPSHFIDVKSGESHEVSTEIFDQIEYHTENQTLIHLVLSALTEYFHPTKKRELNEDILKELIEIKQMLHRHPVDNAYVSIPKKKAQLKSTEVDLKEVDDILDDFGG
ncbi:dehydrogenase [Solibacillus isronensis]|uniref:dehydrogenase n=1 Tax=Solibacillus isronensis TaxID=412383 RepID=UPI0009A62BA5|nr:dehydrogenase [Solibacillus isronensis]